MTNRNTRKFTRMKRIKQFCDDHPVVPENEALEAERTALGAVIGAVESASVAQDSGMGLVDGAVEARLDVVQQTRLLMSSLAKAAKRLDPITYPDVAAKMRIAGTGSFAQLLTRALVFKETLATAKQAFVDLGAPATVDTELDDLITALKTTGDRKSTALDTQVGGTLGIEAKIREGIGHVQEIDAILTQIYRKNPVMLAQWNTVKRATPAASEAPPPASGSGSTQPIGS